MAKQIEGFLEGTYDDITFYKMEGNYYARMKSSLTGKKFWKHKSFEGSRRSCNRFGRGNQLASIVYNEIPEANRKYEIFCRMKREAIAMLKAGQEEEVVIETLRGLKPKLARRVKHARGTIQIAQRYKKKASLFRPFPLRDYLAYLLPRKKKDVVNKGEPDKRIRMKKRAIHWGSNNLNLMKNERENAQGKPP